MKIIPLLLILTIMLSPVSASGIEYLKNIVDTSDISANMIQGSYAITKAPTSLIPFSRALIYDPYEEKWYSVVVNRDSIDITTDILSNPEIYITPTKQQITKFVEIASRISQNGFNFKDKIELMILWFQVQKVELRR